VVQVVAVATVFLLVVLLLHRHKVSLVVTVLVEHLRVVAVVAVLQP
jgi:hypothetical protein